MRLYFYMRDDMKNNKHLTIMIVIAGLIIFVASLESLMITKSSEAFKAFQALTENVDFSVFISYTMQNYFMNIIEPIIITLYTYFTFDKITINRYYHLFFGMIVLVRIILLVVLFNYQSLLYYIIVALYVLYFIKVITINNKKGGTSGLSQNNKRWYRQRTCA